MLLIISAVLAAVVAGPVDAAVNVCVHLNHDGACNACDDGDA